VLLALCAVGLSALVSCEHGGAERGIAEDDYPRIDVLTRTAHEVHGRGQDAELRAAGLGGIVSAFDDQHPAAKPGGVVEPDHGMNAGGHGFSILFTATRKLFNCIFRLESRRAEAHFSPWQLGDSAGQRLGGTVAARQGVLGDSGRTERA